MKVLKFSPLLLLAACSVGKSAKPVDYSCDSTYLKQESTDFLAENEVDLRQWWKQFNDSTLDALVEEAISANYDLKIAIEKIAEMRAIYRLEGAQLFPEIDGGASAERFKISENLSDSEFLGTKYQSIYNVDFDATWEIDLFGKLRHNKKAAHFDYLSQREAARNAQVMLTSEVAKYYLQLRYYQKLYDIAKEQAKTQGELVAFYKDRYHAGVDSEKEELTYAVNEDTTKAELQDLEISIAKSIYAIANLLGKTPKEFEGKLTDSQDIPSAKGIISPGIPSELLQRRPDIRQAAFQINAASERVGYYFASYFPTFSLTGNWGYTSDQIGTLFKFPSNNWSILPGFALPIIDFGRIRSQVKAANSVEKQAMYKYEQVVLKAFKEVEESLISYLKLYRKEEILSSQVVLSQNLVTFADERFRAGVNSEIESLNEKVSLLEKEKSYYAAKYELALQVVSFYKALGGGF